MTPARRLADALAVRDLLYRYARGVDRRDLALVRACFAPGARYEGALAHGSIEDMLAALPAAMRRYASTLHVMGEPCVELAGDEARSTTPTLAYHVLHDPPGALRTVAVRYDDVLERTTAGWRIASRRVTRCWERIA